MITSSSFFKTLFFFFSKNIIFKQYGNPKLLHRSSSSLYSSGQSKYQRYPLLAHRSSDLSSKTLVFNVEGTLLKSSSLFPYFMLVAFEAGSILRAFVLFLLYPFVSLVDNELGLKIMVMACFFGIKKENFRVGRAVLPKFFLEDVGLEAFQVLKRGGRKVAVSEFPRVMIESFLREYLEVDVVDGRELKSVCGYFVGIMEERDKDMVLVSDESTTSEDNNLIGISRYNRSLDDHQLFSQCKEIYLVKEADKRSWKELPSDKYPNPLIFHDGRLAMRPTPLSTQALLMWVPFGFTLAIIRILVSISLPYGISIPMLAFSGIRCTISKPNQTSSSSSIPPLKSEHKPKGTLYVCNHRTLLDPLMLSFSLKKNLTAVTYSLSRMSEIISPIRTVRLTRNRDKDAMMMDKLLTQGDLVVCPEGTTCREPYLLRFSPLFSEMSNEIIPAALLSDVSMFHGTTAGGFKCLDPIFFLMNPLPSYSVQLLEKVGGVSSVSDEYDGERSRFHVANHVQSEIGKKLGFKCTKLTRKHKYLILAGNEGFTSSSTNKF